MIPWLPTSRPASEQRGSQFQSWAEAWAVPDIPPGSDIPPAVDDGSEADIRSDPDAGSEPSNRPGPDAGSEPEPQAESPTESGSEAPEEFEEWGEPEDFASAVRPYTWTRGRTRPVCDLAVETLVSTSPQGRDVTALTSVEHRAVAELCCEPRSVAEVAALLGLPLGVARVLLADMADIGLVVVHRTASSSGGAPEFGFMERVLSGLRRL